MPKRLDARAGQGKTMTQSTTTKEALDGRKRGGEKAVGREVHQALKLAGMAQRRGDARASGAMVAIAEATRGAEACGMTAEG